MLGFEIDHARADAVAAEFAASEKQIDMAHKRALTRTAGTLRRMATSGLRTELGLRNTKALRRRIKEYRVRGKRKQEAKIWFGANDLPLSAFRGRPQKVAEGVRLGDDLIVGGFFARRNGVRGVYRRLGDKAYPIDEARLPVADRIMIFVEDNVFVDLEAIYFKNFAADIKARTIYGVGR